MKEDLNQNAPIGNILDHIDLMINQLAEAISGESPTEENTAHNQDDAETALWQAIRAHDRLSIVVAGKIDQAVREIDYGAITLYIEHHQIIRVIKGFSEKVTPSRSKRRNLQTQGHSVDKESEKTL